MFPQKQTSSEIQLDKNSDCEYTIRLTNFDVIGREAWAETRVLFAFESHYQLPLYDVLAIGGGIVVVLLLIILLRCRLSSKCPNQRVAERAKAKLAEYA